MKKRVLLTAAVLTVTAAPIARPATTAFTSCGTVRGGGASWSVTAAGGVSCRTAKPLVQALAAKPHPSPATRLGTHLGLKCMELGRGKSREIACVSTDGRRSVYGVTPPRK